MMVTFRDLFDGFHDEVESTVSYEQASTARDVIEAIKRDLMHTYALTGVQQICDAACDLNILQRELESLVDEIIEEMERESNV